MVNFSRLSALPLVTLGVLTSQVIAAPTVAEPAEVTTRFSFAEWVDSIIANPDTALSPQEAVQAYFDTVNATLPATSGVEKRGWDAQVTCTELNGEDRAKAADAAFAVNFLAAAGQVPCPGRYPTNSIWPQRVWVVWNTVVLLPFDFDNDPVNYPTCVGLAQMFGVIMDTCTTPDGTVAGYRVKDLTGLKHGGVLGYTRFVYKS